MECEATSTEILKYAPSNLCVITIEDGELDK